MKKNLIVKQDGYKECGAAALLSIIRYYHGNISMNRLLELTHTDKFGTNFYHLTKAAEQIGLEAISYKLDQIDFLNEIKKPFLCQFITHNYEHFVVVYEFKKSKVVIMDPAFGARSLTIEEFFKIWTGYIMILSPKRKLLFYKEQKYLNQIIRKTIQKNKSIVLNILLLSIIFTIISCFNHLYFQIILDSVIDTTSNNLLIITFFFGILLLIRCITNFFRNELLIYLNQKLDCSILLSTFSKLLLLPYHYYKNRTTGEIISRINDLIYIKNILSKIILTVCLDLIIFVGTGIFLLYLNPIMFLILILIILIYLLIFYIFKPILKKDIYVNQKNSALINSFLVESINGFETIKNINLERIVNQKMEGLYIQALNDNFNYDNISNLELLLKDIVSVIGILLIDFLGFHFVMTGVLSIGTLFTYTLLSNYFLETIKNIINLNKEYFYAFHSLKRANHLFEVETDDLRTKKTSICLGNIVFNNLSFSYNETRTILNQLNLNIHIGEKVMIVGSSGSGKSTILKLLLKYYPVSKNSLYLDGIDINEYSIDDVRTDISCVSQNEILYTDTIRNNIIMNRDVSPKEFLEVCQITCLESFVKSLFLGYDTQLEENGLNLSGGQRQRIILARMLLKPSKIILIDEGLNAIDIHLERKILENLFSKYKNQTIIIVSHRLENALLFDKVIRLENGQLIEKSNHSKETLYD